MNAVGALSGKAEALFHRFGPSDSVRAEVRRKTVFLGMCGLAALLLLGLFYVWIRMQQVQVGYEISSLEAKNRDLKNRKRELSLELSSLQSPRELEAKARKLGLVLPPMGKVVHVP